MSGVLHRAAGSSWRRRAAGGRGRGAAARGRAVVLRRRRGVAVAAAAGSRCRCRDGAPPALVGRLARRGRSPPRRVATPRAAARLAARLSAHGLPARARGRLAWLALPAEPDAAAAAVRRASAIVEGPLVSALAGARPAELEALRRRARPRHRRRRPRVAARARRARPPRRGRGVAASRARRSAAASGERSPSPASPAPRLAGRVAAGDRAVSARGYRRATAPGPADRAGSRGGRARVSRRRRRSCSSGRSPRCWSACSCSARSLAAWRARPRRSGRPTSPRWPARGRCTRPTRGCSSRPRSTACPTRGT